VPGSGYGSYHRISPPCASDNAQGEAEFHRERAANYR
jgi:hypothetical protein